MNENIAALNNWIPFRLREEKDENLCQWLYLGDKTFDEPFFDETLAKCRHLEINSKPYRVVSTMEGLAAWAPLFPVIPPAALIFHVSRCGSTLLSQLLSLDPSNIVLSEVPFFDELLRWGFRHQRMEEACEGLRAAVSFHGIRRKKIQQQLFIKADSWHILFYDQWRQLYPDVPVILLYRRPDEVIRSHQQQRGMQAVPGVIEPSLFGFGPDIFHLPLDEYMARVLETFFTAFERVLRTDQQVLAVNYSDGMLTVMDKIASFTGTVITGGMREKMKERAGYHAKHPGKVFKEPSLETATPAYLNSVFEKYNEIDVIRRTRDQL
ncbi:MAG: hypothetical protein U0U70_00430 [Chitinophagaceae bacterium]